MRDPLSAEFPDLRLLYPRRREMEMSARQPGFWDVEERLRELSAQGDPLEKRAATVDFDIFRGELDAAPGARDRSKGGRASWPEGDLS